MLKSKKKCLNIINYKYKYIYVDIYELRWAFNLLLGITMKLAKYKVILRLIIID